MDLGSAAGAPASLVGLVGLVDLVARVQELLARSEATAASRTFARISKTVQDHDFPHRIDRMIQEENRIIRDRVDPSCFSLHFECLGS